jgi:hypothetical protein
MGLASLGVRGTGYPVRSGSPSQNVGHIRTLAVAPAPSVRHSTYMGHASTLDRGTGPSVPS